MVMARSVERRRTDWQWGRVAGLEGKDCGGFSYESESDLAAMVSDFMENGSSGADGRYSSDSDCGSSDLNQLADRLLYYKHAVDQFEANLISVVHSLLLAINEQDLHVAHDRQCKGSCIQSFLTKLLRLSGYDAAICISKWHGSGRVPGVVYVGSQLRLRHFLQIMADAAKCSLKQNSMPLPPWRSLPYLQAKWDSKYERKYNVGQQGIRGCSSDHKQCIDNLRLLKSSLEFETEAESLFKCITIDKKRNVKSERLRPSLLRS